MVRKYLVEKIAQKTGRTRQRTDKLLVKMLETIKMALLEGDNVRLAGFGTFEVRKFSARKFSNPYKKKHIDVDARNLPAFRAAKDLKSAVNPDLQ